MKEWYRGLSDREKFIVWIGALAVVSALVFVLLIEPLHERDTSVNNRLQAVMKLHAFMQSTAGEAKLLRQQLAGSKPVIPGDKLLGSVDQGLKQSGITADLNSITPGKDGGVRLRFDDVSFDALIGWLIRFHNQYGISLDSFSVTETRTAGRVKATLLIR